MTLWTPNRRSLLACGIGLGVSAAFPAAALGPPTLFEPTITGGQRGRIIRVTTLKPDGPGSITEAINAKGARIVVFEVGGIIDLDQQVLRIRNGDITLAGETAPSPGITLIRGGIAVNGDNVIISHLAIRPGSAGARKKSGWECDSLYSHGASGVIVANCSLTWATDEGLSASGPRFEGSSLEDWRRNTSHSIVFGSNIVAEGLSNSTHSKGEHSKGTLIHDNVTDVVVHSSLYAHNMERNILFKGGARGRMYQCVVYNAGKRFAHYNLHASEWVGHDFVAGDVEIHENTFIAGPSTDGRAAAFMLGGEGPLKLQMSDNLAIDARGRPLPQLGRFGSGTASLEDAYGEDYRKGPIYPEKHKTRMEEVLASCGARPWDRDPIDARIVADVRNGTGKIIDSEQDVGGYPVRKETRAPFVEAEWNLDTMERKKV
jgi:hypothetical protein